METTENIIVKMFKIKSYLKLLHCKTIIFVIQISHGCAYVNRHQFTIIISPKYMCFVILHVNHIFCFDYSVQRTHVHKFAPRSWLMLLN